MGFGWDLGGRVAVDHHCAMSAGPNPHMPVTSESQGLVVVPKLPPPLAMRIGGCLGLPGAYLQHAVTSVPELISPGVAAEACLRAACVSGTVRVLSSSAAEPLVLSEVLRFLHGFGPVENAQVFNITTQHVPGEVAPPQWHPFASLCDLDMSLIVSLATWKG